MDIEECLKKRLIRKINPSNEKSNSSIKIAESKYKKAKELFEANFYDESIISAYTSMFHAARALLYKNGYQEKSHYATYIYLNEKYSNLIPKELINSFYHYQLDRHEILYGFEKKESNRRDAKEAILNAEEFLNKIKEILSD